MKLLDFAVPFFAPVGVRVATVTVCVAWGLFEFSRGTPMWGCIFVGIGAIAAWRFATIDYAAVLARAQEKED